MSLFFLARMHKWERYGELINDGEMCEISLCLARRAIFVSCLCLQFTPVSHLSLSLSLFPSLSPCFCPLPLFHRLSSLSPLPHPTRRSRRFCICVLPHDLSINPQAESLNKEVPIRICASEETRLKKVAQRRKLNEEERMIQSNTQVCFHTTHPQDNGTHGTHGSRG